MLILVSHEAMINSSHPFDCGHAQLFQSGCCHPPLIQCGDAPPCADCLHIMHVAYTLYTTMEPPSVCFDFKRNCITGFSKHFSAFSGVRSSAPNWLQTRRMEGWFSVVKRLAARAKSAIYKGQLGIIFARLVKLVEVLWKVINVYFTWFK